MSSSWNAQNINKEENIMLAFVSSSWPSAAPEIQGAWELAISYTETFLELVQAQRVYIEFKQT